MSICKIMHSIVQMPISELEYKFIDECSNLMSSNIQRPIDLERVAEIEKYQENFYAENGTYLFNGTISIAEVENNESLLIDGQHRVQAFSNLCKRYPDRRILLNVDKYVCTAEIVPTVYKIINSTRPAIIGRVSFDVYSIINGIEKYFLTNFKEYLSRSENPHRPNINIEKMKEELLDRGLSRETNIDNPNAYIDGIKALNKFYADCDDETLLRWKIATPSKVRIAINSKPSKLYLGYYSAFEWIDRLLDFISGVDYKDIQHYSTTYRLTIKKSLRRDVWAKRNNDATKGECYVCGEELFNDDFECGHRIPLCRGGPTTLENLEPICKYCNRTMGRTPIEK